RSHSSRRWFSRSASIEVPMSAGENHRRLEWDLRNGVIIRKARAHGLPTPISDVLVPLLAAASDGPG
ncbi:MAG TPA: ketopantoate reductase C-terminal domain-containing protein, partial [Mycobacterium sp.]|nr:ketopantoate reductase C-terminal domain-containing protein [Mycobacterium sp.]